jgi:hypothetical protein
MTIPSKLLHKSVFKFDQTEETLTDSTKEEDATTQHKLSVFRMFFPPRAMPEFHY